MNVFDNIPMEDFGIVCRFCVKKQDDLELIFNPCPEDVSGDHLANNIPTFLILCTGLEVFL